MDDIVSPEQTRLARRLKAVMAVYHKAEDLINIGAYVKGSNPRIDEALKKWDSIRSFLRQRSDERFDFQVGIARLMTMMGAE
jgi:flagellum-specific ATP synthase